MKFYPRPMIRYCIRYVALLLFVVSPFIILINAFLDVPSEHRIYVLSVVSFLCAGSWVLFYFALLEKLFATIKITNDMICWKCPLKKSYNIPISECIYSGVELEDSHNGLPYPFVFVSCYSYPLEYKSKINKLKCNDVFIKYWYSEQLCKYLEKSLPKGTSGALTAYRLRKKHKT